MNEHKIGIGIDLGGTAIKYGLVDIEGKVYWNSKKPSNAKSSSKEVLQNILNAVEECVEIAKELKLKVESIGIGTPGLIKNGDVVLGETKNIKNWKGTAIASFISKQLKLETYVGNDADMMGLGEFKFTEGSNKDVVVFITLGTGIGGAIFIDGKLFQGQFGLCGELGAFPLVVNDKVFAWEDKASTSALVNMYKVAKNIDESDVSIDGKYIITKYLEGESEAIEVLGKSTDYIAMGIAGFVNVFNPKKVVIGGGISEAGEFYFDIINHKVQKYVMKECFENVKIVKAELGNNAGFIGAGIFGLGNKAC